MDSFLWWEQTRHGEIYKERKREREREREREAKGEGGGGGGEQGYRWIEERCSQERQCRLEKRGNNYMGKK